MEKIQVLDKTFRLYIPETEIQATVKRIANELSRDFKGKDPIFCPVLTGSYLFAADLTREIGFDAQVSFVRYTSYEGLESTGEVTKVLGFPDRCTGRDVIIVEDIVDSGISMEFMIKELQKRDPASISICTFFFKPGNFQRDFKIDYVGKSIDNEFIVGYGLDYSGHGRTYRDVYILDR
jgi:hypoxanthine phosphoribosyltransferase